MMETNKVKRVLKSPRMNLAPRGIVFWCQYLQVYVAKINKPKELLQKNVGTKWNKTQNVKNTHDNDTVVPSKTALTM